MMSTDPGAVAHPAGSGGRGLPAGDEDLPVADFDLVAGEIVQRRRAESPAGAEAEAGVMPGQRTVSSTMSPSASGPP
jgi:hypothetical protein